MGSGRAWRAVVGSSADHTARWSRCGLKRLRPRLTGEGAGQHTLGRVCSPRIPLRKNSVELRQMPVFVEFCNLNVGVYRLT